jgi:hypothetical protein
MDEIIFILYQCMILIYAFLTLSIIFIKDLLVIQREKCGLENIFV